MPSACILDVRDKSGGRVGDGASDDMGGSDVKNLLSLVGLVTGGNIRGSPGPHKALSTSEELKRNYLSCIAIGSAADLLTSSLNVDMHREAQAHFL